MPHVIAGRLMTLVGLLAVLAPSLRSQILITEFLADNTRGLQDEDGEFSDWVELRNAGSEPVNLDNWFLTDDSSRLDKWRFPATNLPPDGVLVLYASGKDRKKPGAPLHTSFRLSNDGEYLGLVRPDGRTVEHSYAPVFPPQLSNISYGLDTGLRPLSLISTGSLGRLLIPTEAGQLPGNWTALDFPDAAWQACTSGVGYAVGDLDAIQAAGLQSAWAGYWKLNETSGTNFADASGQGRNGHTVGFTSANLPWTNGWVDGGARFRGPTVRAAGRIPDYQKATTSLSASAWVRLDLRTTSATIIRNGGPATGQFQLGLKDATSELEVLINTTAGSFVLRDPAAFTTNLWQHVAFVADGGLLRLFRDGHEVGRLAYTGSFKQGGPAALAIGARLNDAGTAVDTANPWQWNGRIDEVAVWNRGLSAEEVRTIHLAGAGYPGLVRSNIRSQVHGKVGSVFLRFPFQLADPDSLVDWRMDLTYDDGIVMWLNGEEILRRNAEASPGWNSTAPLSRDEAESRQPELVNLSSFSGSFRAGGNVLAVHLMNASTNDNDLVIDPRLDVFSSNNTTNHPAYFLQPSPGSENRFGSTVLGPVISAVQHQPDMPRDEEDLVVRARVQPTFQPVGEVTLRFRAMYSNELSTAMFDDGLHGDLNAGDGIYGAVIPATVGKPGEMIRYMIVASDTAGRTNRLPEFRDRLLTEEYFGTVVFNPAITSSIPVMHWFLRTPAAAEAENRSGSQASLYHAGEFYDNVFVRIRGGTSVSWPKKSYKVEMTDDHEFLIRPGVGRVTEFDWNTTYTDKSYMRAILVAEHQLEAGMPAPETFLVRLEQNGKFYSVTLFTEQPDKAFLRRHGLDDEGALYKGGPGSNADSADPFEKKTRKWELGRTDIQDLVRGVGRTGVAQENYVFDAIDLPAQVNFLATVALTQNIDASDKNYFLYRDTNGNGEWRMLPWDLDLSFGPNALNTDNMVFNENYASHPYIGARPYLLHDGKYNRVIEAVVASPRARQMILRRLRTLVDQYLFRPYFQNRMDELEALVAPDVILDKAKWRDLGYFSGVNYSLRQSIDRIKNEYLTPRVGYLIGKTIPGITTNNPGSQPYLVRINFGEIAPASGTVDPLQEYLELVNTNTIPVELSGWKLDGDVQFRFKPGTVLPSKSSLYLSPRVTRFRTRLTGPRGGQGLFVQGDYQGELSTRGGVIRLVNDLGWEISQIEYPGSASDVQRHLRISEIMYAPPAGASGAPLGEEFEYLELWNISPDTTLDLRGVRFTQGIEFSFTDSVVQSLAPGARVLVVRNLAGFQSRYGSGKPVAGTYAGSLENGGERLRLEDALGEPILDFRFDNAWHPLTDGLGFSLVKLEPSAAWNEYGRGDRWGTGSAFLGSPGADESPAPSLPGIVVNEVLSASPAGAGDAIELLNPTAVVAEIGGWFLSDDFNTPQKYRIPDGTRIAAGGVIVIPESAFGAGPGGFALGGTGDEVWLFSADAGGLLTGYHHGHRFKAVRAGITLGRVVDSSGREHFAPTEAPTLGRPNTPPGTGPLIISEIGFAPVVQADLQREMEFVELMNNSDAPLPLLPPDGAAHPWRLAGGVGFSLPTSLVLGPKARLLLVGFDPTSSPEQRRRFQERFPESIGVPILGPWTGALNNSGDELLLLLPISSASPEPVWMEIDSVRYADSRAWPDANGNGTTLHRRFPAGFGDDPAAWLAAAPSPGISRGQGMAPGVSQPPLDARAVLFSDVEFRVTATGAEPLRYQWSHGGAALLNQTQAVLRLSRVRPDQHGSYTVIVFNDFGSQETLPATLSLDTPPFITDPPLGRVVRLGVNVGFTVNALGNGPLTYQWRKGGTPIEGATSSLLSLGGVRAADAGVYDVVISDRVGSVISDPVVLSILIPPLITEHPDSSWVPVGQTLKLAVRAEGPPPITYRWRRGVSSLGSQTNALMQLPNIQLINVGNYNVVVANAAGSVTSQTAVVTVLLDADKDGMADDWENLHALNPGSAGDAAADKDGDGAANVDEYVAGTDPNDPTDRLRFEAVEPIDVGGDISMRMSFRAASNRNYAVEARELLSPGVWGDRAVVRSHPTNRLVWVTNAVGSGTQDFFRVRSPRLP